MTELKSVTTTTYSCDNGFRVDVTQDSRLERIEAYIYHADYGVKSLMFGESMRNTTPYEFIQLVKGAWKDYAEDYREEYMQ